MDVADEVLALDLEEAERRLNEEALHGDVPDFDIVLRVEEVTAKPRFLAHQDGTPMLYPSCIQGECPKCEESR